MTIDHKTLALAFECSRELRLACDDAYGDEKEAATAIWNAAWDYAKARDFSTGPDAWQDVSHLFPDCALALANGRAVLFVGGPMGDAQSRFTVSATDADGLPEGDLYHGDNWQAACAAMVAA